MSLRKVINPVPTDGEEGAERRGGGLRVDIPDNPAPELNAPEMAVPVARTEDHAPSDGAAGLARLLLDLFGVGTLKALRDHSTLQGHYIDASSDIAAWLEHVLDTFLSIEAQHRMAAALAACQARQQAELAALRQALLNDHAARLAERETLQRERDAAAADATRLRRNLESSVGVDHVIRAGLQSAPVQLRKLMLEAASEQEANFGLFAFSLAVHWPQFVASLADPADDEAHVRSLDAATRPFWSSIAGLAFARRQELLSTIASCLSDMLSAFDLVSPEDFRVVDPSIHDVRGSVGQRVREGGSFIVFRRVPRVVYQQGLVTLD